MTYVELLVDIRKASGGRPDLANWPNHGAEIYRSCIQHAIRNSEPGSLLVEDSKLKMDPNASVCFDIFWRPKKQKETSSGTGSGCADALLRCGAGG